MQVTDGKSTCARVENPSDREVCFFLCAGDVMAARVVRGPAGGSNSLPDGSVHKGQGTRQLHDVTGKVQHARLIIAAQVRELRVAVLDAHINSKRQLIWKQKRQTSLSGEHDFPGQG